MSLSGKTFKLSTVTMVLWVASSSLMAQTVKLCHDDADSSPWLIKNGKGLNIVLMEEAARKAGVQININPLPWKRCLNAVEDKSMDGAIAASFKDERAVFAVYPMAAGKLDIARRLHTDEYSLYQAKGGKLGWDGKQFSNLTGAIGAQRGYSIIDDLKKAGAKVDEGGAFPKDNMKKIVGGQVQAIALTTQEGDNLLTQPDFAGKAEKVATPLVQKHYFTIFGKDFYAKNQKSVDNLWAAMATIRESKEYKAKVATAFKNK